MASSSPMKKNTATSIVFPIYDNDGDTVTGATGLDTEYSLDGSGFLDCADEAIEIGSSGIYHMGLAAAETNGDIVCIRSQSTSPNSKDTVLVFYTSSETFDFYFDGLATQMEDITDQNTSIIGYTDAVESMLDTNEDSLRLIEGYTDGLTSQLDTNEDALRDISAVQTTHTSMIDTNESMLHTNYEAIAGAESDTSKIQTLKSWTTSIIGYTEYNESMLDTLETYHWDETSQLDTNEDALRSISAVQTSHTSQLNTDESMLNTLEQWGWDYTYSMLETNEDALRDISAVQTTHTSMINTNESLLYTVESKVETNQSFNMWQMEGLGTGMYRYTQDGYYRNRDSSGTLIPWASGETGDMTNEDTGALIDDVLITVYRVNGSFDSGTTDFNNIADQTYTNPSGEYKGYLDPGIYDFVATKTGYVSETIRRELTTS